MAKELKSVRLQLERFRRTVHRFREEVGDTPMGRGVANNIANLVLQPMVDDLAMAIRFDEAENGDPCPACDGTGDDGDPQSYGTCPNCCGVGMVYWKDDDAEETY